MTKKTRRPDEFDDAEILQLTAFLGGISEALQSSNRSDLEHAVSEMAEAIGFVMSMPEPQWGRLKDAPYGTPILLVHDDGDNKTVMIGHRGIEDGIEYFYGEDGFMGQADDGFTHYELLPPIPRGRT